MYLRTYGTLRYVTLRIDTYGSTVCYGFLGYVTLREGGKQAWDCCEATFVGCKVDITVISSASRTNSEARQKVKNSLCN